MQVNRLPQETGGRRAAMKAERKETARAPR
jgi:hypothetical protein